MRQRRQRLGQATVGAVLATAAVVLAPMAPAGAIHRCAVDQLAAHTSPATGESAVISDDGRVVAFVSGGSLDPDVTNTGTNKELYLWERGVGFTQLTNTSSGNAADPAIDADGSRVAFSSSQNLVGTNNDGSTEIYLWDETNGITQVTNTTSTSGSLPDINDSGTDVVFQSTRNLTGANADLNAEVFHYPVGGSLTQLTGSLGDAGSTEPAIGEDVVAFGSAADLVPATGNADHSNEIFTYDLGTATFAQLTDDPAESSYSPAVSGDDSAVAFQSTASLVPGANDDHNGEVFVTDLGMGTNWEQITQTESGGAGLPALDGTGDRVVFTALNDLVPAVGNDDGSQEAFLHDRQSGLVQQLTDFTVGNADYPSIDASGLLVALQFTGDPNGDNPDHTQEVGIAACGANGPTFTDYAPGATYYEQVEWMSAAEVASGFPDGTFRPQDFVKRQQMANFLYNLAGQPPFTAPVSPTFSDYPPTSTYYAQVEWMVGEGIASGFPDGTFRPQDFVKRQQMANFLYNLAGQPAFTPPVSPTFNDYPPSSTYYLQVEWMAAEGVASGFPDGTFRPQDFVKRQQMANFLYNLASGVGVDLT